MGRPHRVLLVSPSGATPTSAPLPGLLHLCSALLAAGIDTRVLDLAAPHGPGPADVSDCLGSWEPEVVGIGYYTETALQAYRLLASAGRRDGCTFVAGGPHATSLPGEALAMGFDVVVHGEGEGPMVGLVQALFAGRSLEEVPNLSYGAGTGEVAGTRCAPPPVDLDRLPSALNALGLFDRGWYADPAAGRSLPATLLTSRGCSGSCTFCANVVCGRRIRAHSVARVVSDMERWHAAEGSVVFDFADASFAADRSRLLTLCAGLQNLELEPRWWCEARIDQIDAESAAAMAGAGCVNVILGIESGDPAVLRRIRKGIDLDRAEETLRVLRGAGIRTQVNFMLGFPGETVAELESTLRYMERIAPLVDLFTPMGIVMPYPGTSLYDSFHEPLGFGEWWLDEEAMARRGAASEDVPADATLEEAVRVHESKERAAIEETVIPHDDGVRRAMERCAAFRREHNLGSWLARAE